MLAEPDGILLATISYTTCDRVRGAINVATNEKSIRHARVNIDETLDDITHTENI